MAHLHAAGLSVEHNPALGQRVMHSTLNSITLLGPAMKRTDSGSRVDPWPQAPPIMMVLWVMPLIMLNSADISVSLNAQLDFFNFNTLWRMS